MKVLIPGEYNALADHARCSPKIEVTVVALNERTRSADILTGRVKVADAAGILLVMCEQYSRRVRWENIQEWNVVQR